MAEFCKDCFTKKLLNDDDRKLLNQGKLKIHLYGGNRDLCEGCGKMKSCVSYVEYKCDGVG